MKTNQTQSLADQQEAKKFGFKFPETLSAYRAEYRRLEEEFRAVCRARNEVSDWLTRFDEETKRGPQTPIRILRRRNQKKSQEEKLKELNHRRYRIPDELNNLHITLREEEGMKVLSEGEEIQTPSNTWSAIRDGAARRRVLVNWRGKPFLLCMVRAQSDKVRPGTHVEWFTDSLDQFTDEELQCAVQYQSRAKKKTGR